MSRKFVKKEEEEEFSINGHSNLSYALSILDAKEPRLNPDLAGWIKWYTYGLI